MVVAAATALCYVPSTHRLIAGDVKGVIHVFDLQKNTLLTRIELAKKCVRSLSLFSSKVALRRSLFDADCLLCRCVACVWLVYATTHLRAQSSPEHRMVLSR